MGNSSTKNTPIALTLNDQDAAENLPKDIMIMASLEQMAVKFSGLDHTVVWQDPNIRSPENISYLDKLGLISDLKVFESWQEASSYIQQLNIPCQALTSGANGESFISTIAGSPNVKSAYVFCGNTSFHRSWAKKYPGLVVCVENDFGVILDQMKRNLIAWQRQNSSLRVDLPAFGDADVTQMNKIHYYLKSFVHFNNREQAKSDFLTLSGAVCRDKNNINAFYTEYKEYDMKKILSWYTRESFLYKIVNNCLRIASADAILYARLIIRDLELAIKERYGLQSSKFNGLLYRGTYISAQEWSSLEARIDREIEMFGFLSTTKAKDVALSFVESDIAKKALITIVVPAAPDKGEQGFAEVRDLSDYAAEDEVLFNIRSRFTVLEAKVQEINGQSYRHLVLLYGAQAMRSFISTSNPITEINLRNLDPTKCGDCHESIEYTSAGKSTLLFVDLKRKEHYTCFKCLTKTKANKRAPHMCLSSEQVNRCVKEDSSIVQVQGMMMEYTESTTISLHRSRCKQCQSIHQIGQGGEQCQFRCLTCCNRSARWCESCFDVEKECLKSGHEIIVEFEPFTFWSERMSTEEAGRLKHHKERQKNMASLNQAKAYFEAEDYEKAKRYYEEYLKTNNTEQTKDMATIYSNLAIVYRYLGDLQQAKELHIKALETKKSVYGEQHSSTAESYNNLAMIYRHLGDLQQAKELYIKALETRKSVYGEQHSSTAQSYNNLAEVYRHLGDLQQAKELHIKALETRKSVYGEQHSSTAQSYNNLAEVYRHLGDLQQAKELYIKSYEIFKLKCGEHHSSTKLVNKRIQNLLNLID